jgi:Uma2 family endonuclease
MAEQSHSITANELWCLSDDGYHRYELDRGRLLTMTPSGSLHGAVTVRLAAALSNYVDLSKAGVVLAGDAGFKLESDPDTVRAPDVAFISRDRIPSEGLTPRFWQGAPDLAVEVFSPGDKRSDVNRKIEQYLKSGVQQVWFVEPTPRRVTIHTANGKVVVLREGDTLEGGDLLPGFQYRLSRLFDFEF